MLPARRNPRPNARTVRRLGRRAFTLIEMLAAIAIVAILVATAVGTLRGVRQRAMVARAKSELAQLAQALEEYKRHYGDYPQTGPSTASSHIITPLANGTSNGPGLNTAQAILFNSLTGVYGPTGTQGGRLNGPSFVDVSRFTLEAALVNATFGVPTGSPPAKQAVNNAFVDPWGCRYMYFYKRPTVPGRPVPPGQAWSAPAYVLYSTGPDGTDRINHPNVILPNANGVYTGTQQTTGDNADNIYADKLQ